MLWSVIIGVWLTVTLRLDAGLVPLVFDAVTLTVPPEVPTVTVIELVPLPEVIVQPAGIVHVYDVAPVTSPTEYTCPAAPEH